MKYVYILSCLFVAGCAAQEMRFAPAEVAPPPWPPVAVTAPEPPAAEAESLESATTQPDPEAVPLAMSDAVVTAFQNNRSISVSELDPQIASTLIDEARAAFDPAAAASMRWGKNTQRIANPESSATTGLNLASLGGTTTTNTNDSFADVVGSIQAIMADLAPRTITSRTEDVTGTAVVSEYLPTGTTLSVNADYSGVRNNLSDDVYRGGWSVEVSQALLRGAGLGVNLITLRQARNSAAISFHGFRRQVLNVVRDVELTYWDLVLAQEVLDINEFGVELAEEQARLNQDLLNVGRGVEADVLSAQAERASREADVTDARAQIRDRNVALIRLLNPEAPDQWQISFDPVTAPETPEVKVAPAESVTLAMEYRPELAQAKLDLANADLNVRQAKNNLLPQLDLVASAGRTNTGGRNDDAFDVFDGGNEMSYGVGFDFQTPILRRGEKARYRSSRLQQTQGERVLGDTENSLEAEVRQAIIEVQRQQARIEPTQEAMRARARELETARARYQSGRSTNLDVLIVQRDYIQAQLDEVSARIGYLQALTSLYAAEGTLLERRGIHLE